MVYDPFYKLLKYALVHVLSVGETKVFSEKEIVRVLLFKVHAFYYEIVDQHKSALAQQIFPTALKRFLFEFRLVLMVLFCIRSWQLYSPGMGIMATVL